MGLLVAQKCEFRQRCQICFTFIVEHTQTYKEETNSKVNAVDEVGKYFDREDT